MSALKVLIVEDEFLIARNTQYVIEDMGYEVVGIAMSGEDAVEKAQQHSPDVIIMDMVLQGDMDGLEAAGRIREFSEACMIFVSGNLENINISDFACIGQYRCIGKPYDEYELAGLLKECGGGE